MSHRNPTLVPAAPQASRRALLMGLAAAATPIAPALATAMGGLPASPPGTLDPIFAVIAEHRALMRAWADAMEAQDVAETDAEFENATDAMDATSEAFEASIGPVLTTQPTTIAGVAALLEHVGQEEFLGMSSGGDRDSYETVLTTWLNTGSEDPRKQVALEFPLRLAATVRRMIGMAGIRQLTPAEPDPIFAAIERHRVADAELDRRCSALDAARTPEAKAALDALHNAEEVVRNEMLASKPTTAAGAAALLRYAAKLEKGRL